MRFVRIRFDETFLDAIGPRQAWFLGLMAADGNVQKDRYFAISQSGERGLALIQLIQRMLQHEGKIYHYKNAHNLHFCSKKMVEIMAGYGIIPRKSLVYEFPKKLPKDLLCPFMRGYIDGDGSAGIYFTGTTYVFCINFVGTERFIFRCNDLLPIKTHPRKIKQAKNLWELRFYGENAIAFGRWIWQDTRLPRYYKQDKLDDFLRHHEPKYVKAEKQRNQVRPLLQKGLSPMEASRTSGVPFQSIYRWIHGSLLPRPIKSRMET